MIDNTNRDASLEVDFNYYLNLLLRRRWIVLSVWLSTLLITAVVTFNTRPLYRASSLVIIEKERNGGGGLAYQGGSMIERDNEDYYQTQYRLLKSDSLLTAVYNELKLDQTSDYAEPNGVKKLSDNIDIAPIPKSRLLYIKVSSHEPKLSASIANSLANEFIQQNLSNQMFISQDVLQALKNKQAGPDAQLLFESLPAVVNNPLIQQLKQETAKIEAQVAELSGRYTARHPQLLSLKANLETLKNQIRIETNKIIQSLKIDLSGQLLGNNIRMIDEAVPPSAPFKPQKKLNIFLGLIVGFILGLLIAVIMDLIDQTIRTQEDVENKLGLPFLGVVPFLTQNKSRTVYAPLTMKEQSLTSESIRNLRTMVDFAEVSQKEKMLFVTSTMQGEGKSYVGANLAVAIAQTNERVLIIDGDLRRSNLHKLFKVSNSKGLSDFLAKGKSISELPALTQATEIENLQVMTCGPRPPNPAELLNTPRLQAMLSWAQSSYDRVIIDCPPIFPISDTLLWGKYLKQCIFITKYGQTRVPIIKTALQRIEKAGIKILGIAVNMSKFGDISYSYYGHYYYKYHHYYYAHDDAKENPSKEHASPHH